MSMILHHRARAAAAFLAIAAGVPAFADDLSEGRARLIAQFHRGADAVRPCERLIDSHSSYLDCTVQSAWGYNAAKETRPFAYILGSEHEQFLHYARNGDIMALVMARVINDDIKRMGSSSVGVYCLFYQVECQEFLKYWTNLPTKYPRDKTVWLPAHS